MCEQGIERSFHCHSVPGADYVSQAAQLLPHQISLSCSEETISFVSLPAAGSRGYSTTLPALHPICPQDREHQGCCQSAGQHPWPRVQTLPLALPPGQEIWCWNPGLLSR